MCIRCGPSVAEYLAKISRVGLCPNCARDHPTATPTPPIGTKLKPYGCYGNRCAATVSEQATALKILVSAVRFCPCPYSFRVLTPTPTSANWLLCPRVFPESWPVRC